MVSEITAATARDRRLCADVVDSLEPEQHESLALCEGWTVRVLTAHMLQPMEVSFLRFAIASLRAPGHVDATIDSIARRRARAEVPELTRRLRQLADMAVSPPRVGPYGPFAETCIHLRDMARPLRLDADVSLDDWRRLLDYLVSRGRAGARPRGPSRRSRSPRHRPAVASLDGAMVEGPSEALAMVVAGRPAALDDVDGPGVELLRSRMAVAEGGP